MAHAVPPGPGNVKCPKCDNVFSTNADPASTPHAALILSLDGGGIKGYSSLLILKAIMEAVIEEETRRNQEETGSRQHSPEELDGLKRPSAYFDYIVGTSTGGLIATMLGRLKLTVDDCISEYETFGEAIFAHPRKAHVQNKLWLCSKFDWRNLERVMREVVEKYKLPDGADQNDLGQGPWKKFKEQPPEDGIHRCKTVAVAVKDNGDSVATYLFRSYIHPVVPGHFYALNPDNIGCEMEIVQVARATSAAPGYFKAFQLDESDHTFMDGGVKANNPSALAWTEAIRMARLQDSSITAGKAIGCFISIGTGKSRYRIFGQKGENSLSKYRRMMQAQGKIITDTDPAHKEVQALAHETTTPYFRFNVTEGLQDVKLDEWKQMRRKVINNDTNQAEKKRMSTLEYLQLATETYLDSRERIIPIASGPEVSMKDEIKRCAEILVNYRRARRPRANSLIS